MLKTSTIITLHDVFKSQIGYEIISIRNLKGSVKFYDRLSDKNNPNTKENYECLNRSKNRLRKDRAKLRKLILMNRMIKNLKKQNRSMWFSSSELQYMLSIVKKVACLHDGEINYIKRKSYYHYRLAVPGTKKGLLHFLLYNDYMNQYRKELKKIRRIESVIIDLKSALKSEYEGYNALCGRKPKPKKLSFGKRLNKLFHENSRLFKQKIDLYFR